MDSIETKNSELSKKLDIVESNELLTIFPLIAVNLMFVFYYLMQMIINVKGFYYYNVNDISGLNPNYLDLKTYIAFTNASLLAILISLNFYLLILPLFIRFIKHKPSYSVKQILIRFFIFNFALLSAYFYVLTPDTFSSSPFSFIFVPQDFPMRGMFLGIATLLLLWIAFMIVLGKHQVSIRYETSFSAVNIKPLRELLVENAFIYYLINLILILSYLGVKNQFNGLFLVAIGINVSISFLKALYDRNIEFLDNKSVFKSFFINMILFLVVFTQYFNIEFGQLNFINVIALYILLGLLIVLYLFREKLIDYLSIFIYKTKKFSRAIGPFILVLLDKINPIKYILTKYTLKKLNNNDQAVFFARRFIIIQSDKIKNSLPAMLPETVSMSFERIFIDDIDRMNRLLKINKIKSYSEAAVLKFIMSIARPIIIDMQRTLQEYLTLELLKNTSDSKNLQINIDDLWKKVNKIMANWESTFSDSELEWKDSLLIK